jgi:hypothetical protein
MPRQDSRHRKVIVATKVNREIVHNVQNVYGRKCLCWNIVGESSPDTIHPGTLLWPTAETGRRIGCVGLASPVIHLVTHWLSNYTRFAHAADKACYCALVPDNDIPLLYASLRIGVHCISGRRHETNQGLAYLNTC